MSQENPVSEIAVPAGAGLAAWMDRTVARADRARDSWDSDSVHDLRVALRRCRAMAETLSEVNSNSGWTKIRKSSRGLFHALGALRDLQVEREWIKKLASPGEPLRTSLLRRLSRREKEQREAARKALDKFQIKEWKKLSRKLDRKAELFPVGSIVFQRIALAKLSETAQFFARARKTGSGRAWHQARIGLKHFRYLAENFLPRKYAMWSTDLKRLQDLLGDIHDLDVLRLEVRRNSARMPQASIQAWYGNIRTLRKAKLQEVTAKTNVHASVLDAWRSELDMAHSLAFVPLLSRRSA